MKIAFYKGTRKGLQGVYSRGVRWWTQSPYSHAEIIFSNGMSASSSFVDGGVRFKRIEYNEANWDIIDIAGDETEVLQWFLTHVGAKYDLIGNLIFILAFISDIKDNYSCAESIAAALGYNDAWRYSPAVLFSVVTKQTH